MRTKYLTLLLSLFILAGCDLFRRYKQITVKPREFYENITVEPDTSSIAIDLSIDYRSIEKEVNLLFNEPVLSSGRDKFDQQYRAKSKNPAYDPVKWIKTRDPLHNSKKWIKIGGFKTKNPAYHPRKWMKTKNPKYNPNKWIYANTVRIEVGYNYQYSIAKRSNIAFSSYDNQTLRITVPIEIDGHVGFEGDGAKLFSLTKKNFKTKVDFHFDSKLSLTEDWCPKVETNITFDWIQDPKIEISGGVWLNLIMPADLGLAFKVQSIENEIKEMVECQQIQDDIKTLTTPSSRPIPESNSYLNIYPIGYSLSQMYVDESLLKFQIGSEVKLDIGDGKFLDVQQPKQIKLKNKILQENLISLNVPVNVDYSLFEKRLNEQVGDSLVFKKDNSTLIIKKFLVYPSGKRITIGVQQQLKTKGKIFSEKGTIYLTAEPTISDERFLEFVDLSFSTEIDNDMYPILGTIFYDPLTKYIVKKSRFDLKPSIEEAERIVEEDLINQFKEENGINLKMMDVQLDITKIRVGEKLSVDLFVEAGLEVEAKAFSKNP